MKTILTITAILLLSLTALAQSPATLTDAEIGSSIQFNGRCPVCVREGKRSTVTVHGMTTRTLMGSFTFYDEDGKRHHVDPNITTTGYSCSVGHHFSVETQSGKERITEMAAQPAVDLYVNGRSDGLHIEFSQPRSRSRSRKAARRSRKAVKHAHAPQSPAKPANIVAPASIPIPEPEASQMAALQAEANKLQAEFQQKMQGLQAQWSLINTRAALRAKLSPEQLDSLVAEGDGKGGLRWVKRPDPPKTESKEKP